MRATRMGTASPRHGAKRDQLKCSWWNGGFLFLLYTHLQWIITHLKMHCTHLKMAGPSFWGFVGCHISVACCFFFKEDLRWLLEWAPTAFLKFGQNDEPRWAGLECPRPQKPIEGETEGFIKKIMGTPTQKRVNLKMRILNLIHWGRGIFFPGKETPPGKILTQIHWWYFFLPL